MTQSGIVILPDGRYGSTLKFSDINYQLASDEVQTEIWNKFMTVFNSAEDDCEIQLTIHNRLQNLNELKKDMMINPKNDNLNQYRDELNGIMYENMVLGKKTISDKYISYSLPAEDLQKGTTAIQFLTDDFTNKFKEFGCDVQHQNGDERLQCLYKIMNPDKTLHFNYDTLNDNTTTKDAIAPDLIDFKTKSNSFILNNRHCKVYYLKNYSTELSDQLIQTFAQMERNLTISFHMKPTPRGDDVKLIKKKIVKMEEQKSAIERKNIDRGQSPESLPLDLKYSMNEATDLLEDVQKRNQRLFECQFMIMINEESADELEQCSKEINSSIKRLSCEFGELPYRQEEAFNSILPINQPVKGITRTLTTAVCAIVMPFTSQELMQKGNSYYYGVNSITRNPIMCDRRRLKNPTGWILGTPGSGKSFAVKTEITNVFLSTNDDLIIIDPEKEYTPLVKGLGGETISIDTTTGIHVNPFDGDINQKDFLATKAEFAQTITATIIGHKLTSIETSLIDRCIRRMYDNYIEDLSNNPNKEMPSLNELTAILKKQDEKEAKNLAVAYEMYTNDGSYNLFSGQSNVQVNSRIINYNIRDLGETLRPLGMLVVLESLWNKIISNFLIGKRTWIWIDEIYLLFKDEYSEDFLYRLFKRARKFGAVLSGITQNVEELLASLKARTMLSNSEFILMLNQATSDSVELANITNISDEQLKYVKDVECGSGLLKFGVHIIPFKNNFPKETKLYELFNTNFDTRKNIV